MYFQKFCVLFFLIFTFFPVQAEQSIDLLIMVYDMGDINPLKRVMTVLDTQKTSYSIIGFGKAEKELGTHPHYIQPSNPIKVQKREQKLTEEEINDIISKVKPKRVLSSMAALWQAQLLNQFKKANIECYAFYDNFDPLVHQKTIKEYVVPFLNEIGTIDKYLVPCNLVKESFKLHDKTKDIPTITVGQPTLEEWDEIYLKTNIKKLAKELNLDPQKKTIVFAGGYDSTYKEYLEYFIKAVSDHAHYQALITYHPATDGSIEKNLLEKYAPKNIQIVTNYKTVELSTVADIFACHKSSMGPQALYKNKKVLFVAGDDYSNFVLDLKLAEKARSVQEIKEKLNLFQKAQGNHFSKEMGIPSNATENIVKLLTAA